jgi:SecD/SecF fusion protein
MKISKIVLSILILVLVLFEGCFTPKAEYEIKAVIEISEDGVLRDLSVNRKDTTFNRAIVLARKRQGTSKKSFVELFGEAFAEIDRDRPLAALFTSRELKDRITYNSTNEDVLKVLKEEIGAAIDNSYNILTDRINKFGIPKRKRKIEINSNRLFVTIKFSGEDPNRIISLIQAQGKLGFWETYKLEDIYENLLEANNVIRILKEDSIAARSKKQDLLKQGQEFPLFYLLHPRTDSNGNPLKGSAVGRADFKDTAEITRYLNMKQVRDLFPADIKFLWSAYTLKHPEAGRHTDIHELYAVRSSRDDRAALDGDLITKAHYNFNRKFNTHEIYLIMNPEGTVKWARFTHFNIGRTIAIVIDNLVYSAPVVKEEIRSGRAVISGNFSIDEAQDLANILNSNTGRKLSCKMKIISLEVTR